LAQSTIQHFTAQIKAVDQAIYQTINDDDDLHGKRDLLLSISGVGDILAAVLLAQLPGPDVLKTAAQAVAYAGLNPRQHQSGSSVHQPTRISRIGNAKLRTALFMPAMVAMRFNPVIAAFVTRLRERGRLKGKQIVVAAMRKLLVICFGVLKSGKPFDPAIAMAA
jgi:transposase